MDTGVKSGLRPPLVARSREYGVQVAVYAVSHTQQVILRTRVSGNGN